MTRRLLAGPVAAALVAAAGLVGLSSAPAAAATCSGAGVNVVVDFNGLGGGVRQGCDPRGANRSSDKVFPAAGFTLTYAQRQPGFVCRVNGTPASDPCVNTAPANAYWGLFWSDGRSGTWHYSSTGVGGLKVPEGGFVALSWQGSQSKDPPSATPVNHAQSGPTSAPTEHPGAGSGGGKGGGSGGHGGSQPTKPTGPAESPRAGANEAPAATRSAAPAPGRARTAQRSPTPSVSSGPTASASESPGAPQTLEPTDQASPGATSGERVSGELETRDDPDGLPAWVPVVVIVGLAGAAGGSVWWRRRTGAA